MEEITFPAAAVLICAIIFGGLFYAVSSEDREYSQLAKVCIDHGMQWHDQTNDCTKG